MISRRTSSLFLILDDQNFSPKCSLHFSHLTNILLYLVFELNVSMQKCCLLITDVSTESENVPLYFRQSFYYPDMENICAIWSHCIYQQIVGITMDTNFTPLIADVFLCSHERDFILNRHKPKQEDLLKTCLTIRGHSDAYAIRRFSWNSVMHIIQNWRNSLV